MASFIDLTGHIYGKLTVLKRIGTKYDSPLWECICACGKTMFTVSSHLRSGNTFSCGCSRLNNKFRYRHGQAGYALNGRKASPEYKTWIGMVKRCLNEKSHRYKNYGGRGIKVCERWLLFDSFFEDMGVRPSPKHSIDRIDVNGNYEPVNCRWATVLEQAHNKTNSVFYEYDGKRQVLAEWARELGTYPSNINRFFKRGFEFSDVYKFYKFGIKAKKNKRSNEQKEH